MRRIIIDTSVVYPEDPCPALRGTLNNHCDLPKPTSKPNNIQYRIWTLISVEPLWYFLLSIWNPTMHSSVPNRFLCAYCGFVALKFLISIIECIYSFAKIGCGLCVKLFLLYFLLIVLHLHVRAYKCV